MFDILKILNFVLYSLRAAANILSEIGSDTNKLRKTNKKYKYLEI